jgi:hypothetical protein
MRLNSGRRDVKIGPVEIPAMLFPRSILMRRLLLSAAFLVMIPVARADGLDIFLNNDVVSVDYLTSYRGADINAGFMFNKSSDWVANAGLLVLGREYGRNSKVEGGFGGKLFLANVGGSTVTALGIGGQAIWFPRSSRFGVGGYGYYAPDITTGGGRSFLQLGARAEFQLMETASIYVGFQNVTVEPGTSGGRVTLDDGIHLGVNLRF